MDGIENPSKVLDEFEDKEDRALLQLWVEQKSQLAFDTLHDRYFLSTCSLIGRIIGSRSDAEDIWQEVALKVFMHPPALETLKVFRFRPWLMQIVRNAIRDYLRRKKKGAARFLNIAADQINNLIAPQDVEREVFSRLTWHAAIAMLSSSQQDIVILRYVKGLDLDEIANILGSNRNAISVRIFRARRKLIECVENLEKENGQ